jgi:hypothetical protein
MPRWPADETAVVTTDDMEDLVVFWPQVPDETAEMPRAARFLVAMACKWKCDQKFVEEVLTWYEGEVMKHRLKH